jgi:hypothetical protein
MQDAHMRKQGALEFQVRGSDESRDILFAMEQRGLLRVNGTCSGHRDTVF